MRHEHASDLRDTDARLSDQERLIVHHTSLALVLAEDDRVLIVEGACANAAG